MRSWLSTVLLLAITTLGLALAGPPGERVREFSWQRDYKGVSAVHSGKRPFWPKLDREALVKLAGEADLRYWVPPGASARYWVVTTKGRELELSLADWARLTRGDEVPN